MATQIYTPPNGNETSGIFEFFKYTNDVSGGIMFPTILMVIWFILFISTKQFSSSRAWTYSSFITSIMAIILSVLGLIAPRWMYLTIFMTAIGMVWLKLEAK